MEFLPLIADVEAGALAGGLVALALGVIKLVERVTPQRTQTVTLDREQSQILHDVHRNCTATNGHGRARCHFPLEIMDVHQEQTTVLREIADGLRNHNASTERIAEDLSREIKEAGNARSQ